MKKLISFSIIFILLTLFPVTTFAASAGTFTFIRGRVDITRPGEAARTALKGDEVNVGDIVRTKRRARAEITFVDGNILRLAKSTRVEITKYLVDGERLDGSIKLFRGRIRSIVKRVAGRLFGRNRANRYEVRTPTAVCGVRGTDFDALQRGMTAWFGFREGEGETWANELPDDIIIVKKGESSRFTDPGEKGEKGIVTLNQLNSDTTDPKDGGGDDEPGDDEPGGIEGYTPPDPGEGGDDRDLVMPSPSPLPTNPEKPNSEVTPCPEGVTGENCLQLSTDPEPVPLDDSPEYIWIGVTGTQWLEERIAGDVTGAWVDIHDAVPTTGVMAGTLRGTFDPTSVGPVRDWQGVASGSWIETTKFLTMVDDPTDGIPTLQRLNIPAVEVGVTNLTGSGTNLPLVNMNNVRFFAYSTNAPPRIWATGDVNGQYSALPNGQTATLSGPGFGSVDFTVNYWEGVGGKWAAQVSGNNGTVNGHAVDIEGGAAGTVSTGGTSFSGTGAGVARPSTP